MRAETKQSVKRRATHCPLSGSTFGAQQEHPRSAHHRVTHPKTTRGVAYPLDLDQDHTPCLFIIMSTSTEALLAERPAPLALLVLHQSGPNQLLHYCDTHGAQSSSKQKPLVQLVLVLVLVVPFVCPCSKEQDAVQLLYLLCCPCTTVVLEGTTRERDSVVGRWTQTKEVPSPCEPA